MHSLLSTCLFAVGVTQVAAHGYVASIITNGVTYPGWAPFSDPYVTPEPTRYTRRIQDNGPVPDFTSTNITCNVGGNNPAKGTVTVKAGDKVRIQWDQWGSSHSGPVMNYIASCNGDCSKFKGDTGSPWVKFDQMAYDASKNPPWGSDYLAKQGAWWDITVPNVVPGQYLLRHEILGLHVAGTRMGAQFYPSCTQLIVTGSGTKTLPTGVALPGAYNPDDAGILVQLWRVNQGLQTYVAPGGPVKSI